MSESTIARLKGDKSGFVHPRLVENYINSNPDKFLGYRAEIRGIKREDYGEISELKKGYHNYSDSTETQQYSISGWVLLLSPDGTEKRSIFYSYNNIRYQDDVLKVAGIGKVVSNYTYLSLGYNEEATIIMKELLYYFGGWYEENDCDDNMGGCLIPYQSSPNEGYKPPRFVTMKDIYEKFGEFVIIKDIPEGL